MRNHKPLHTAVLAAVSVLALTACGSSSKPSSASSSKTTSSSSSGKSGGTVTIVFGTAPDSLDPGASITTQGAEPLQVVHVPPYFYAAANGIAGTKLIPALATALPTVSADGTTYTFTLRSGLKYSNGQPVKASDFVWAFERALKIPWPGSSFINPLVVGSADYASGKAKTLTGVTANDSTGQVTIHLTGPYGAFENVLAFPAMSPVPSGTPFKNLSNSPPVGVGPYKLVNIVPNVSYSLVKNPDWTPIPGIPSGYVNQINAKISSNTTANALSVLNNSADVYDQGDTIPPSLVSQIASQAADRFKKAQWNGTYYFFLNQRTKPFSSQLAREAVAVGLDRPALSRLGSGYYQPGCFFLPPLMAGHPAANCPYGDPNSTGDIAKAKMLVKESGMAGTSVTVWGEERPPRRQFVDYYTSFLNQIGFNATEKIIADATYFPTINNLKLNAQTGFDDYNQDFPNPIDFYGLMLAGAAIGPVSLNHGRVNDPHINSLTNPTGTLAKVPTDQLSNYASQWTSLDEYTASKAYEGVFGYLQPPWFVSNRIDQSVLVLQPINGWLWNTFALK
jgi:peptide/nickel transport system substrate-binding protein